MTSDTTLARSAIESLRNGVPSRHAVAQLGTTQHALRDRFTAALDAVAAGRGASPVTIAANFGAGKSHLLACLRLAAEQAGFVTATVVVSPESPLGNPRSVLKAVVEDAHAPHHLGNALRSLLAESGLTASQCAQLRQWVRGTGRDDRFAALTQLYEDYRADDDFREQILADWEDQPLTKSQIKARLKDVGQLANFDLSGPPSSALAHDRLCLLAELYRQAGAQGLVIFFDELERLAKFSLNQRLKALTEVGWLSEVANAGATPLYCVFAMTDLYLQTSVTGGTRDGERFGGDSQADQRDAWGRAGVATLTAHDTLEPPTADQEAQVQYRIKALYELAYDTKVPPLPAERYDAMTPLRYKIRKWIARWDLHRYAPDYASELQVDDVQFDTAELSDELSDDPGGGE